MAATKRSGHLVLTMGLSGLPRTPLQVNPIKPNTGTAVTAVVTCDVDFHPVFQCHVWTQIRVHRTMINISVVFVQIKQIGRLKKKK
jgi:hypothetical protein